MTLRSDDRGQAAAEFAVVLPAILMVLVIGVGALAVGSRQLRLQDAASAAVRVLARGEGIERAEHVLRAAIGDATLVVERTEELVCAVATAPTRVAVARFELTARACGVGGAG